jgi:ribosomal protein S18 acetylase RimI-like enzyme
MDDLAIRPMEPQEADAAGKIVAANPLWHERYQYPAERASRELIEAISRGDTVISAHTGSVRAVIGFAWVLPKGAFGRFPYLRLLAVAPWSQKSGVGAKLLAEAEARHKSARQMLLMVSDFNEGAQRFYKRCGYQQVGSCPDFLIDGIAEQLWMKRLSGA